MDAKLILWIFLMVVGFVLLIKGADWFVEGAAGIAEKCRISPLVIGLTVVAFGTSAPELAVSITSALKHATDLSMGNVLGSNITNILLILGLAALIRPLPVQRDSVVLDIPVLLLASVMLIGLGVWQSALQWWDGLILLVVFAGYMFLLFRNMRKQQKAGDKSPVEMEPPREPKGKIGKWFAKMEQKTWFLAILTVVGLGMVAGGSTLLVDGATYIANKLHVPQDVIGLTVVAIGTSLPELVTSVVAAKKGETDIAVGNVIGSNIFNIFLVAGVASLFYPLAFSVETLLVDALIAFGAAALLYAFALIGKRKLGRASGAVMLALFVAYYVYLFVVRI